MYLRRILAKALIETRKFWTIHRNWTFAAGPISAIAFHVMRDGWPKTRADIAGTFGTAVIGFVIAWVGTLVINIVRSTALLDQQRDADAIETHRRISELTAALDHEQYNLSQSPQLILGFNEEFFIRNIGQIDGRDAKIHSMRVNDVLLYSDEISYIGIGDTIFNLRCRKGDGREGSPVLNLLQTGVQAFRMFIEEIARTTPLPEAITSEEDPVRRASREYQYMMMNNHMLTLDLMYSDFSGHQYLSPSVIVWTMRDGGWIVEVRPQAIKKLMAPEAKALARGNTYIAWLVWIYIRRCQKIRMKAKYHIYNLLRVGRSSENLALVFLQRPQPIVDHFREAGTHWLSQRNHREGFALRRMGQAYAEKGLLKESIGHFF